MAERSVSLVLRDASGAIGLTTSSAGVHLGESDDLPSVTLTAEDHVAADLLGVSPLDVAIARELARIGVEVNDRALPTSDLAGDPIAFATRIRDAGASIAMPSLKAHPSVRGRGDVLSGETEIRELRVDRSLTTLRFSAESEILASWADGSRLPSQALSVVLGASSGRLRDRGLVVEDWEVAPGLRMLPILTPTLPPATHTNAFVVGTGSFLLVEPASPFADEIERIARLVETLRADGGVLEGLVLTHHHPDHAGGAAALRERLGVPVIAHERTAQRLAGSVIIDRLVSDGDVLELDGPTPMSLELLHTPGHAPGHLCLFERRSGALIAGDMVAGVGTILVEPYDGDMELYLASLDRLRALGSTMILPAHGGVVRDPRGWLSFYISHRLAREAKIVAALAEIAGPTTIGDLVPLAYADTSPTAWPLARMASAAHLEKLVREGRVVARDGERFELAN